LLLALGLITPGLGTQHNMLLYGLSELYYK
jgi:hypothetical protein